MSPSSELFPEKLRRILDTCTSGAISWSPNGRSILINVPSFEREYLHHPPMRRKRGRPPNLDVTCRVGVGTREFNAKNISSFTRQLNLYGFHKATKRSRKNKDGACARIDGDGQRDHIEGNECIDLHQYTNPLFRRDRPNLVTKMERTSKEKENKPPERAQKTKQAMELPRLDITQKRKRRNMVKFDYSDDQSPEVRYPNAKEKLKSSYLQCAKTPSAIPKSSPKPRGDKSVKGICGHRNDLSTGYEGLSANMTFEPNQVRSMRLDEQDTNEAPLPWRSRTSVPRYLPPNDPYRPKLSALAPHILFLFSFYSVLFLCLLYPWLF